MAGEISSLTAAATLDGTELVEAVQGGLNVQTTTQDLANLAGTAGGWDAYTPTWTASGSAPAIGNGTLVGAYVQIGKTVHFRIKLVIGSTTTKGSGLWKFTLPVGPHSDYSANTGINLGGYMEDNGVAGHSIGGGRIESGSTFFIHIPNGSNIVGAIVPFTWGTGDFLSCNGTYEAA